MDINIVPQSSVIVWCTDVEQLDWLRQNELTAPGNSFLKENMYHGK